MFCFFVDTTYVCVHTCFIMPDMKYCVTAWYRTHGDWWGTSVSVVRTTIFCYLFQIGSPLALIRGRWQHQS